VEVDNVRALAQLPGTRREVEAMATHFGVGSDAYLLGAQATEIELRARNASGQLRQADVIVLATHGLMAGYFNGSLAEPALVLTPPPAGSTGITATNDGLLTASEGATLKLSADWLILSTCNTAAGGTPDAEGLTCLARAFLFAGARTLRVSHWPVDDTAAQRLTTRAVALADDTGISPAAAMRQTMADLMADTSNDATGNSFAHPTKWAPFITISAR